jgi:hypothetical protein
MMDRGQSERRSGLTTSFDSLHGSIADCSIHFLENILCYIYGPLVHASCGGEEPDSISLASGEASLTDD